MAILWHGKTRVMSYELRVESLKARVDSLKAWVKIQKCKFKSTIYKLKSTSSKIIKSMKILLNSWWWYSCWTSLFLLLWAKITKNILFWPHNTRKCVWGVRLLLDLLYVWKVGRQLTASLLCSDLLFLSFMTSKLWRYLML